MRYDSNQPLILNKVSFKILPGQNIGIIGKTNSGKTSIIRSITRQFEIDTGNILIDDINISKIGKKKLRQSLCIIPQNPFLKAGTIRSNIDPLNEFDHV